MDKATATLMVEGGIHQVDERTVEFGYAVAPAFRGRGLATEFAAALIEQAVSMPWVRTVPAHTYPPGTSSPEGHSADPSIAVLRRLGFDCVGQEQEAWRWQKSR